MVYERAYDTLKASDVLELGILADGRPAPGLLALRWFVLQAKLESLPTPNLTPFKGSAGTFPIPSECQLLKAKSNSLVFQLTTSEVLKKLNITEAFEREFAALRGIPEHESLIKGVAYDMENMYLVTHPLGVCDLASIEVSEGILPQDWKTKWLGLLEGLKALHNAGWVHRDIRPENIVKTGNGRFVLIDVGLAAQEPSEGRKFVGYVSFAADLHLEILEKEGDTYSFTRGSDLESFLKTVWYSSCASITLQNVLRDKSKKAQLAEPGSETAEAIRGLREFWDQQGIPALGTAFNSYEAALKVTVDFIEKQLR
jgi:serine/threonine protein kinase